MAPLYLLSVLAGASLFIVPTQAGFLLNLLHVDAPQQIGLTMGANQLGVLACALSFRLIGILPAPKQLLLAFLLAGVGGLLMATAGDRTTVVIAVLINGLGFGLMLPILITSIMSYVDFKHRGRAAGGFTAAIFVGEFISPLVVLGISSGAHATLPDALLVVAVMQLLVSVLCLAQRREAMRHMSS